MINWEESERSSPTDGGFKWLIYEDGITQYSVPAELYDWIKAMHDAVEKHKLILKYPVTEKEAFKVADNLEAETGFKSGRIKKALERKSDSK